MKRRTHLTLATLLLAGSLGITSCAWKGFNDLEGDTPVAVYTKDKNFSSPTFGISMLVLQKENDDRLPSVVVGGQYTTPLAVMEIGASGNVEHYRILKVADDEVAPHADREGNTVVAMTELSAVGDDARVLIGVPMHNYVRWVRIPPAGADEAALFSGTMFPPENAPISRDELGGAVAAGFWDGLGPQDWAVASNNDVYIFTNESEDASTTLRCNLPGPGGTYNSSTRALVAGTFDASAFGQVFLVGLPHNESPYGTVRFLRFDGSGVDCGELDALIPPDPPLPEPERHEQYFGTSLAAVDLDGALGDDLIVGSPNKEGELHTTSRVYVYMNNGTRLSPSPSYILEGTTQHFGTRVAAMDLDGDGVMEVVVGDPMASFHGNRGRVLIFKVSEWAPQSPEITLSEEEHAVEIGDLSEPEKMFGADLKDQSTGFGWSLAGLQWTYGAAQSELFVGSSGLIFGFYLTSVEGDDGTDLDDDPRD